VAGVGLLVLVLVAAPVVVLGSDQEQVTQEAEHAKAAEHGDSGGHEADSHSGHLRAHKNEIAIFVGGTDEHGHDTEFTWGLDYKRRVAERWALGMLFDYAGGGLRNAVLAPSVSFWPPGLGNLQLLAAPGVEFHQGRDGGGHEKAEEGGGADKDATYFLFRLGIAYDIHLGERFGIVPMVNLDFVNNEEVWVYGFAFTYGF